ncbi:hypothetical protein FAF44_37585 [Nonomuraea sp. MG754425]|uniref:hypothetical protein n=1 Tax=Nonomuraea sp. MG754425 TaxID=2570319 RepID=UPI001F47FB3A|nr:hypothetical protein [Nonomuraea sp. MG754425]MCF6474056.1 hypothetical protein [Nonomuraea sp. MG754425]
MTTPKEAQVSLVSSYVPAVEGGTYTITFAQSVDEQAKHVADVPPGTCTVRVDAPRFALDPTEVVAVHPPPAGSGNFGRILPHLVATSRMLPWARDVHGDPNVPWLALLLLADAEVVVDPASGDSVTARTAATLAADAPRPDKTLFPALQVAADEHAVPCRTMDVRLDALTGVMPAREELPWLAYVRDVTAGDETVGLEPGAHSVLMANRFPRAKSRYTAAVVSLEGLTGYTFCGGKDKVPAGTEFVRLVVLWSWTLNSDPDAPGYDFAGLAENLIKQKDDLLRVYPGHDDGTTTTASAKAQVSARLQDGYVPVVHRLPSGEQTPAWYRGPFTPRPAAPLPAAVQPFTSADAALIYQPEQGVFDVSYACAYTLGQLVALAHPQVLKTLGAQREKVLARLRGWLAETGADPARSARWLVSPALEAGSTTRQKLDSLLSCGLAGRITTLLNSGGGGQDGHHTPAAEVGPGLAAVIARMSAVGGSVREGDGDPVAAFARAVVDQTTAGHDQELARVLAHADGWLGQVPFGHLVAHQEMLPPESVRFFFVDKQWIDALGAGACSVGAITSLDHKLGGGASTPYTAGCLLRSALIRDWPKLSVEVTEPDDVDSASFHVHASHPLPDVLQLLFTHIPGRILLREPPHGVSIGIDTLNNGGELGLRAPCSFVAEDGTIQPVGKGLTNAMVSLTGCMKGPGADVLRMTGDKTDCLTARVKAKLAEQKTKDGKPLQHTLTPASLALQLLNGAGRLVFTPNPANK